MKEIPGMVPLPVAKRTIEAYHEVAWLYLLDRRPEDLSWIEVALSVLGDHLSPDLHENLLNPDTMLNWDHFMEVVAYAAKDETSRCDHLQRLIKCVGATSSVADGARMSLDGSCRSDLFLTCSGCGRDRVVIEVKGPQADLNRAGNGKWQTENYELAYQQGPGVCTCDDGSRQAPLFVLLDARGRSRADLVNSHDGLDLTNWHVVSYREVLGSSEVEPAARWLWESLP